LTNALVKHYQFLVRHNSSTPQKMSDKLQACRCLPEPLNAGSPDKLEACRTTRAALFILSRRRHRHEVPREMILSFRSV
jgi:hypothetical protein